MDYKQIYALGALLLIAGGLCVDFGPFTTGIVIIGLGTVTVFVGISASGKCDNGPSCEGDIMPPC